MNCRLCASTVVFLVALVPCVAQAGGPRQAASKGIGHYQAEEYDKALAEFMAGLEKAPDRQELRYDLGTAFYKLDGYPRAAEAFGRATSKEESRVGADAWYNLGNSLFKAGKLKEAVESYKNALRLEHQNRDAKHNLELALRLMQMAQQQPQSGQGDSTSQGKSQQQPEKRPGEQQKEEEQQAQSQPQPQTGADSLSATQDSSGQMQQGQQSQMTPEEAMQLLQALEGDEQEAQKEKLIRQFGQPKRVEKDW